MASKQIATNIAKPQQNRTEYERSVKKILKFPAIAIPAIGIKARPIKTRRDNESEPFRFCSIALLTYWRSFIC